MFAEDFGDFFEGLLNLGLGVRGHEAETDKGIVGGDGGRDNGVDEDAVFKEVMRDGKGLIVITNKERNDGRGGVADLKAAALEALKGHVGKFPQVLPALRLFLHNIQGCQRRGGACRGDGGREDV